MFIFVAAMTTYHVYVYTGDKFGAGTDADVYIQLFGVEDDTGTVNLKSSKTHKNKFERNQMDEFVVQAVDIGELQKIKLVFYCEVILGIENDMYMLRLLAQTFFRYSCILSAYVFICGSCKIVALLKCGLNVHT